MAAFLANWAVPALPFLPLVMLTAAWALVRRWNFAIQLFVLALCVLVSLPLAMTGIFMYTHPEIFKGAQQSPGIGLELFPLIEVWHASVCVYVAYALFGILKRLRAKSQRDSKNKAVSV